MFWSIIEVRLVPSEGSGSVVFFMMWSLEAVDIFRHRQLGSYSQMHPLCVSVGTRDSSASAAARRGAVDSWVYYGDSKQRWKSHVKARKK
jgi:hypothetical protein